MAKPKLDSAGISLFCESVAMMLAAGIQTDEAVGMLSEDIGDVALQATCESVYGRLCAGDTLAVAMKASGAFPRYAVDMVGVGEASGRLEEVLRSLGVYYDEEDRLFAKIRSSVGYPAALLCIMSIILAFTVIIILPVFEDVYVSMAGSLTDGSSGAVGVSVAIGWVASEESFLRNSEVLTWFKIRASVGQVGNDQIPSTRFIYLATINSGANGYGNLGVNFDQGAGGIGEGRMANQDVTWEVSTKYNVGIETGFFNELKINADFFYERRENIFLAPQFSEISGLPKDYTNYANMGLMENRGFEVSAEYVKRFSKDLTVSVRGNFTFARNKVIDDGKYYAYPWQDQRGVRYGLTMGYRAMHLFSQEELDNMPDYYTQFGLDKQQLRAGDIRYEDLNDDGKITEADMTWIGNPAMPEIVYGFGASLNYKGFDFSFLFQGGTNRSSYLSGGWYFYPFQADRGPKFMGNVMTMFKDRWTVDNPDPHAFSPRLSYGADANNYKTSTWWQRDSGYLRLKNVEIGYTLPSAWASKLRCSSLRIYATGVNLFTVSKFISDYWDPETGADAYPMQRQVFVGVNLTF